MVDTIGFANGVGSPLVPTYDGRQLRQLNGVSLPMGDTTRPLGVLSGVRAGTPTDTVTVTSTTWTCQGFAGAADVMVAAEAGGYPFAFDGTATGDLTAADGSNDRVDIIYVKIADPEDDTTVPIVERLYLAGTAAGTPVAPDAPAGGFTVAQINMPKASGGDPTVTWVAPEISGGWAGFQTLALLKLWTTAAKGQHAAVLNDATTVNNGDYKFDGTAWFKKGLVGYASGPSTQTDYTSATIAVSTTVNCVAGHTYKVSARFNGTQETSTSTPAGIMHAASTEVMRITPGLSYASGTALWVSGTYPYVASSTGSVTFDLTVGVGAGAVRIPANGATIDVICAD